MLGARDVTKKKGDNAFCMCKPLMLDIHTQCELLKFSKDRMIVTSIISISMLIDIKLYYLISMDHMGLDSLLISPRRVN
jgi:hypothetical protein